MDARVYLWGSGGSGCLGHGTTEDEHLPKLLESHLFSKIYLGGCHSAGTDSGGRLYTWGEGTRGQLGHGEFNCDISVPRRVVSIVEPVSMVACGWRHSLAVTASGYLYAWGDNKFGQLGLGNDIGDMRASPTQLLQQGGDLSVARWERLCAGWKHSLACDDRGRVFAWGLGRAGQLGDGCVGRAAGVCTAPRLVPMQLRPPPPGGDEGGKQSSHVDEDNAVTSSASAVDRVVGGSAPTAEPFVVDVVCGWEHSGALCRSGEVYTWGSNKHGQLGRGTAASGEGGAVGSRHPWPGLVPVACGDSGLSRQEVQDEVQDEEEEGEEEEEDFTSGATAAAAAQPGVSSYATCVGTTQQQQQLRHRQRQRRWKWVEWQLRSGWSHMLLLRRRGYEGGPLSEAPAQAQAQVQVQAELWGWGRADLGQLGVGGGIKSVVSPCRLHLPPPPLNSTLGPVDPPQHQSVGRRRRWRGEDVFRISCGSESCIVVTESGVWTWGWAEHGNLGLCSEDTNNRYQPVRIPCFLSDHHDSNDQLQLNGDIARVNSCPLCGVGGSVGCNARCRGSVIDVVAGGASVAVLVSHDGSGPTVDQ